VIRYRSAGGGGWSPAGNRAAERVALDERAGYLSD
jgi:N-methylhydantoinase B/oxoprolinase/acetone carboxylase alpha subunit